MSVAWSLPGTRIGTGMIRDRRDPGPARPTVEDSVTEQHRGRGDGSPCKACGSRPAGPAGDGTLCESCAAVLELPDAADLVEDRGAAVRRAFEHRDPRPEG
ncbi:hypothetical protein GCM10010129_42330 [Streptomyces fumigatiscleroticus]|nr:hypothetical protein GCM10010129_42330 [Streptomyces fumigatiscleroticus]